MGQVETVALAYYDCFARGDFAAAKALYADDCAIVTPNGTFDNAAHEAMGRAFREAFPDSHMEVVRVVESDGEAYVGGVFKGTHTGDLVGAGGTIPASGNAMSLPFADYFRVADGKIVAQENLFDQMTLMAQIGALPPPA
jgi:steroid delta-isomerase-like uncharacterized protein